MAFAAATTKQHGTGPPLIVFYANPADAPQQNAARQEPARVPVAIDIQQQNATIRCQAQTPAASIVTVDLAELPHALYQPDDTAE